MAITKTTEIGQVEVTSMFKHVQVRTDTIIKEDGNELSRSYHRHVLHCGSLDGSDNLVDTVISGEDAEVQAIANAVWTDTVKNAWKAKLIADKS
tara:strand:- start:88 stop:369 length:282 start_codon:yes stop_codon:yes gene_type:complete